jgi:hypothetical protein
MNIIYRSFVYDLLYLYGSHLIDIHNPCEITRGENGKVTCRMNGPCCGGCKYLGENGCTTKSLGCKIGLCYEYSWRGHHSRRDWRNIKPEMCRSLEKLWKIALKYNMFTPRRSKAETLELMRDGADQWHYNAVLFGLTRSWRREKNNEE